MHSRLLPFRTSDGDTLGGFARLATLVQRERAAAPGASLLVDAGDVFQGTPFFNFYKGEAEFACMSAIGYEAMALGNHELDEGADNLLRMAEAFADFPVLSVNVAAAPARLIVLTRGRSRTVVAVLGATTENLESILTARAFEGLSVEPVVESLRHYLPELRRSVDLVVLLSHCGLDADSVTAATVPGIDVIISGHDHRRQTPPKLVRNPDNDNGIGGTLLVEAGSGGTRLGVLDITIEDGRITHHDGRLVPVTADIPEDSTVAAIVEKYRAGLELFVSEVIAESPLEMPDGDVLREPTALGNFVADCLRRAAGTDIALQNGGGIRAPLHAGPVRIGDIYALLPFDNTIVTMTLTGRQVLEMCREAAEKRGTGGFGAVSGITFTVERGVGRVGGDLRDAGSDRKDSTDTGVRVSDVRVGGAPLDAEGRYTVAVNSFTAGGGDGYTVFREERDRRDSGVSLRDAVIDLVRKDRVLKPDSGIRIRLAGK